MSSKVKMTVLIFTLTYCGMVSLTWGSKLQQNFMEDGELQSTAWEILKTLGGHTDTNQSEISNGTLVPSSAISTEIFAFGEQVISPSSSKQRKLGDLRSLVNQIKKRDDHDDSITSISSGACGREMGIAIALISITILVYIVY